MSRRSICSVDALQHGQMALFTVGAQQVLLVRSSDGQFHAVRNLCAHQGVDLSHGVLTGHTYSDGIGHYGFRDTCEILRCPRHGYEFDVKTGASRFSGKTRIRVYPVSIENGQVLVDI